MVRIARLLPLSKMSSTEESRFQDNLQTTKALWVYLVFQGKVSDCFAQGQARYLPFKELKDALLGYDIIVIAKRSCGIPVADHGLIFSEIKLHTDV